MLSNMAPIRRFRETRQRHSGVDQPTNSLLVSSFRDEASIIKLAAAKH